MTRSARIEKRAPAAAPRMLRAPAARAKSPAARAKPAAPPPAPRPASKISITVDADVLQEVRELLRGTGQSLSAHVTESLARDLRRRRLRQIIEEYEAEHGVIGEDELAEARAKWRG